jgi:hypothetical protein
MLTLLFPLTGVEAIKINVLFSIVIVILAVPLSVKALAAAAEIASERCIRAIASARVVGLSEARLVNASQIVAADAPLQGPELVPQPSPSAAAQSRAE